MSSPARRQRVSTCWTEFCTHYRVSSLTLAPLGNPTGAWTANAVLMPAGSNGAVTVRPSANTGLLIDLSGYFDTTGLAFYPMTPFSLNVTAAPQGSLPWLTAWPADLPYPYVSTLNATDGNMTANAAIVQAKSSGNLALVAGSATDVFVDINGYFAPPATGGLYFYPIPPCRVVAAKNVQSQQNYAVLNGQCPIPATAQAYSFNATAAPKGSALWQLSIWPAGQPYPSASTLNSQGGLVKSNAAIVGAGSGGQVTMAASDATDVNLDANGYFSTSPYEGVYVNVSGSVTSGGGTGTVQRYTAHYTSPVGRSDVVYGQVLFTPNPSGPDGTNACQLEWDATGNLTLVSPAENHAGRFGQGTLSNASCTVDAVNSSLTATAGGWDVTIAATFSSAFAGMPAQVYAYGENASGLSGPWMPLGAWLQGGAAAMFVKTDTATRGNWIGVYGADGYRMATGGGDYVARPGYLSADPTLTGNSTWQWTASTSDASALRIPGGSTGLEAAWYASGSFTIDVPVADAAMHQLAVYCANYDAGQWPNRSQRVQVTDASGNVLDTRTVSNFSNGVWLVWKVKGHVKVLVTNTGTPNALVSGVSFDGGAPGWAAFVRTDTATHGAWVGVYGADGYWMARDANGDYVQRPGYLSAQRRGDAPDGGVLRQLRSGVVAVPEPDCAGGGRDRGRAGCADDRLERGDGAVRRRLLAGRVAGVECERACAGAGVEYGQSERAGERGVFWRGWGGGTGAERAGEPHGELRGGPAGDLYCDGE